MELEGLGGDDTLEGGDAADQLFGGSGDDVLRVGDGDGASGDEDRFGDSPAVGDDTIEVEEDLTLSAVLDGGPGMDRLDPQGEIEIGAGWRSSALRSWRCKPIR